MKLLAGLLVTALTAALIGAGVLGSINANPDADQSPIDIQTQLDPALRRTDFDDEVKSLDEDDDDSDADGADGTDDQPAAGSPTAEANEVGTATSEAPGGDAANTDDAPAGGGEAADGGGDPTGRGRGGNAGGDASADASGASVGGDS